MKSNNYGMPGSHFPKIVGTATLNEKGQLVIPVEARNKLDLKPGSRVVIMSNPERPSLTLLKAEVLEAMVRDLTDALGSANDTKS